jgi:putative transposase
MSAQLLPVHNDVRSAKLASAQSIHTSVTQSPAEPAYLLTLNTLLRRPLFLDPDAARSVARMQGEGSIWGNSRCLAWVLMPDRWQGLVVPGAGDSLDRLVRRFKAISARAVDPRFRINGWLWAKGFDERGLLGEEDLLSVARHLVASPVRARLAKTVGAYPYWNAVWLDAPLQEIAAAG